MKKRNIDSFLTTKNNIDEEKTVIQEKEKIREKKMGKEETECESY